MGQATRDSRIFMRSRRRRGIGFELLFDASAGVYDRGVIFSAHDSPIVTRGSCTSSRSKYIETCLAWEVALSRFLPLRVALSIEK